MNIVDAHLQQYIDRGESEPYSIIIRSGVNTLPVIVGLTLLGPDTGKMHMAFATKEAIKSLIGQPHIYRISLSPPNATAD